MLAHPPAVIALLALIIGLGTTVQTSIGFGAMVLSVTLGSLILPVGEVVPLLVPVTLAQTAIVAVQARQSIAWALLARRVFPLMGLGFVASVAFVGGDAPWMRPVLGGLVLVLALRELLAGAPGPVTPWRAAISYIGIVAAGVVHGIFATGGPVLVWSLGQQPLDKATFRATLTVVWLTLNTILVSTFVARGRIDAATALTTATLLPTALLGIALGHQLHDRVDEDRFRTVVWTVLVVASVPLLLR